jgi:hypothetical protein
MGTKEKQEGRGGCGPEGTSNNRGEGGSEVPLFVLAANWRKRRQKIVVHATVPGKKTKKV